MENLFKFLVHYNGVNIVKKNIDWSIRKKGLEIFLFLVM